MSIDLAYAELGLPPGASESEVRAAWRRLVSRWHPDRNRSADAVDLMQRINSAYERIRLSASAGGAAPPASAPAAAPARTLRRKVRLSLEEAALGCTRVLRGRLSDPCGACAGAGELHPAAACPRCQGSGTVRSSAWFGWLPTQADCSACAGSGRVPRACPRCAGAGRVDGAYRRSVRIPPGVRSGDLLSAAARGDAPDGFDGTLELQVEVATHRLFVPADDGTLRCEMPVDGFAWLAGAWIDVPTLAGLHQMRLQRGRHAYRLRGQGLPLERGGRARGDYLITVLPSFPERLSARQQALLDELAQAPDHGGEGAEAAPLRAWRRTLQAWERGRQRKESAP